jgi:hypothetical protein
LWGVFAACGVLPLELNPAYSVGDQLAQHLDELQREAEEEGGIEQVHAEQLAEMFGVRTLPQNPAECPCLQA